MVEVSTIKAGDMLYDCHRHKMGNTNLSTMGCWDVRIVSIEHDPKDTWKTKAVVSWNGNRATTYYYRQLAKLRRNKPKPRSP